MKQVPVSEAKAQLSRLLRRVAAGEEITIVKRGVPVARLVPIYAKTTGRKLGVDRGKTTIPDDFDAPLPDEILDAFVGKEERAEKR